MEVDRGGASLRADDADAVMPVADGAAAMDADGANDRTGSGLPSVPRGTGGVADVIGDGCGVGGGMLVVGDLVAATGITSPTGHHG